MRPYAFFIGCQIPARVQHYELAARAVLGHLGVSLKDFRLFNCCGYPMRNADEKAYLLSAAKNIALAEKENLDILALCKCCFGSLKWADHLLKDNEDLRAEINGYLAGHGLAYCGSIQIKHLLSVLHKDLGTDAIKPSITRPFHQLKVATHYGCHALRPSRITQFDNPVAPRLFDELVELTGATSVEWETRLHCCGAPLTGINDMLSEDLTRKKLEDAKSADARFLCTACPYCQLQFDTVQAAMLSGNGQNRGLPSILYPQMLGLSMGLKAEHLGFSFHRLDIGEISAFLKTPRSELAGNLPL